MRKFVFILLFIGVTNVFGQQRPNIIFIMADDLGYGDIEPYGQKLIKTPQLSRLAREGMRFTQHYAGTSVCAPSRCVLMTGKHTGHSEIRANRQAGDYGQVPLSDQAVTVAEVLKKAGYVTGMIGKWGLGEPGTSGDPLKQGFDFYYGYTDQVLAHNHYPEFLLRNGKPEYLKNKVQYLDSTAWHKGRGSIANEKVEFADELFTNEAIRFITANKDSSFFLYLPYIIPHDNGEAAPGQQFESPLHPLYENKPWTKDQKDYASSITFLDEYIGRIRQTLADLDLDRKTLVIFTSDNGPHTDEFGFSSSGGLRGIKRSLYEGGTRVPFIAWWPGTIKPGRTTDHISGFWDFMAVAADLAGVTAPENDGLSFVPTLTTSGKQKEHEYVYFEIHEAGGAIAVRKGNWKGVINKAASSPAMPMELYNLARDPRETTNLAARYPEKIKELNELISKAHQKSPVFMLPFD